ncbi:hypothetical protein ACER0C_002371 [Sarotherodon galilaeus]
MSAVTASLCSTLLLFSLCMFTSADHTIITAVPGEDVTLPCQTQNNIIRHVQWCRADLEDEELVLLYHHGRLVPDYQHPSFENRVDLKDRQITDGDVSLILKNVTTADSGTYRCRVIQRGRQHMKLISIIYLRVGPPKGRGIAPVFFNTADSAAEVPDSQQDPLTGTDHKIITAVSGQDVTLTCRAQAHIVIVVEWSRTDLEDEELVLLYQHGRLVPDYQHPSFENRVDLKDRQIADGDVSLILKDVRQDDAGTYECRVIKRAGKPLKLISIINLKVGSPTGRGLFNTVDGAAEIPDSKQDTLPGPVNNTSPPATGQPGGTKWLDLLEVYVGLSVLEASFVLIVVNTIITVVVCVISLIVCININKN